MTTKPSPRPAPKIGRVGYEQTFKPAVKKRRLVDRSKEDTPEAALAVKGGEWLRELRESGGLSLTDAAKLLSVSKPTLSMIEHGKNHLAPRYFESYAAAMGVTPREFVKKLLSYYAPQVYEILLRHEDDVTSGDGNSF
jgi:DNA-binding XRE family transcriptional regulator